MTHFASFTAAAQLHFGIVTDAGAISMNAAFPQFSPYRMLWLQVR